MDLESNVLTQGISVYDLYVGLSDSLKCPLKIAWEGLRKQKK